MRKYEIILQLRKRRIRFIFNYEGSVAITLKSGVVNRYQMMNGHLRRSGRSHSRILNLEMT